MFQEDMHFGDEECLCLGILKFRWKLEIRCILFYSSLFGRHGSLLYLIVCQLQQSTKSKYSFLYFGISPAGVNAIQHMKLLRTPLAKPLKQCSEIRLSV
uniref:Uncharacterized protein n=1 Tax=Lepeophtheirus salmonis TaxID=72036 RepID=A0A0K2TFQ3_LEPSM